MELVPKSDDFYDIFCKSYLGDEHAPYNNLSHCHDFYELEFIIKGEIKYDINGIIVDATPGSLHLVTPVDFHHPIIDKGCTYRYYNIQFTDKAMSLEITNYILSLPQRALMADCSVKYDELLSIMGMLASLNKPSSLETKFDAKIRQNLLEILLLHFLSDVADGINYQNISHPINMALEYIRKNFASKIRLEDIADYVGMSRSYFCVFFMKKLGIGLWEYIQNYRLNRATQLLTITNLPIKEIALDVGYKQYAYFSRSFTAKYGLSPLIYRSNYSKNI